MTGQSVCRRVEFQPNGLSNLRGWRMRRPTLLLYHIWLERGPTADYAAIQSARIKPHPRTASKGSTIRMPTDEQHAKWRENMVRAGVRMVRDKRRGGAAGRRMSERATLRHPRYHEIPRYPSRANHLRSRARNHHPHRVRRDRRRLPLRRPRARRQRHGHQPTAHRSHLQWQPLAGRPRRFHSLRFWPHALRVCFPHSQRGCGC